MVNFKPTEEQELLRDTLQSFAREVVRQGARECDEKDGVPADLVQKGWELGLVQTSIPEEYGGFGSGRSAIRSAIKLEELAYGDLAITMHLVTPRLFTVPMIVAGTPEQQKAWLPRFAGDAFTAATAAVAEPVWNFDARIGRNRRVATTFSPARSVWCRWRIGRAIWSTPEGWAFVVETW
jgi:alkylation response protein AidB-like acyl-CoA dehydrogenase